MNFSQKTKKVFFIYSEASLAVFMVFGAVVELICGLVLSHTEFAFLGPFAYVAAAILFAIALKLALGIYKDLKCPQPSEKGQKNEFLSA